MKLIRRLLIGLGILLVALAASLGGAILVDGWLAGGQLAALTNTAIVNESGQEIGAYVARPDVPGPYPAVILIHEFWGLNQEIRDKADALADEGYLVIAPDLFRGSTAAWVPRAIFQVVSTPQAQILGDLDAVFAWLISQPDVQPDRIAIVGFCFGGGLSLRYSLSNRQLAGTVIFYGPPIADATQLKSLPGPVLGIFGGADQSISVEQVRAFEAALNEAGVQNKISIYEGQPHGFVRGMDGIRQGGPPGQAWAEALAFLDQTLGAPGRVRRDVLPAQTISGIHWEYWIRLAYTHVVDSESQH